MDRKSANVSDNGFSFHGLYFLVGEIIELIYKAADLAVGGVDLALEEGFET